MTDGLILALDQGTTSTRAIAYDTAGAAVAQASRPLAQSYPADGWVEHDAETIFADAVAVMREAIAASGRPTSSHPASAVAALGIANQRETVVVWERASGRPIHPAVVWQDRRTAPTCERLREAGCEAQVAATTGLLLDPYFSAAKIAWVLDRVEGARAAAERGTLLAGTIDTWLVWKLTGGRVHATDPTNASRTSLMDLRRQSWDDGMLRLFDVPAALLPEIRDTAGDFGETQAGLLGAAVPIRALVGDQQAALFGHGGAEPGALKATYGTGAFMLLHTGETAPRSSARLLSTAAARIGGQPAFALEGSMFSAGPALPWAGDLLGGVGWDGLESLAARVSADHRVLLVPAFTGLGAPWWDPRARGAVLGLTRDAGAPELAAAAYDSVALQTRDLVDAMRADAPEAFGGGAFGEEGAGPALRIDGGMARSRLFPQRLADLTGLEVHVAADPEITARGAARLAAIGAGLALPDPADAAPQRFAPSVDAAARDAAHARWRAAVAAVRGFAAHA